jgi:hypothetical protein
VREQRTRGEKVKELSASLSASCLDSSETEKGILSTCNVEKQVFYCKLKMGLSNSMHSVVNKRLHTVCFLPESEIRIM